MAAQIDRQQHILHYIFTLRAAQSENWSAKKILDRLREQGGH